MPRRLTLRGGPKHTPHGVHPMESRPIHRVLSVNIEPWYCLAVIWLREDESSNSPNRTHCLETICNKAFSVGGRRRGFTPRYEAGGRPRAWHHYRCHIQSFNIFDTSALLQVYLGKQITTRILDVKGRLIKTVYLLSSRQPPPFSTSSSLMSQGLCGLSGRWAMCFHCQTVGPVPPRPFSHDKVVNMSLWPPGRYLPAYYFQHDT